jgi:Flp pilus assembly protein protease CpaA
MGGAGARRCRPTPWSQVRLAADLVFIAMLATVTVTDLRERRIPNRVLGAAAAPGLPLLALADPGTLPERLVAALVAGGLFLALALGRPGGFGLGDVKLIATMGLFLGPAVTGAVLIALIAGTLYGAALFARHGSAAARLTLPFAPFLAVGAVCVLLGAVGPIGLGWRCLAGSSPGSEARYSSRPRSTRSGTRSFRRPPISRSPGFVETVPASRAVVAAVRRSGERRERLRRAGLDRRARSSSASVSEASALHFLKCSTRLPEPCPERRTDERRQ